MCSDQKTFQQSTTWHRQVAKEARGTLPSRRWLRQPTNANMNVQRLMQQLEFVEHSIALGTLLQESLICQVVLQVAIALPHL